MPNPRGAGAKDKWESSVDPFTTPYPESLPVSISLHCLRPKALCCRTNREVLALLPAFRAEPYRRPGILTSYPEKPGRVPLSAATSPAGSLASGCSRGRTSLPLHQLQDHHRCCHPLALWSPPPLPRPLHYYHPLYTALTVPSSISITTEQAVKSTSSEAPPTTTFDHLFQPLYA